MLLLATVPNAAFYEHIGVWTIGNTMEKIWDEIHLPYSKSWCSFDIGSVNYLLWYKESDTLEEILVQWYIWWVTNEMIPLMWYKIGYKGADHFDVILF